MVAKGFLKVAGAVGIGGAIVFLLHIIHELRGEGLSSIAEEGRAQLDKCDDPHNSENQEGAGEQHSEPDIARLLRFDFCLSVVEEVFAQGLQAGGALKLRFSGFFSRRKLGPPGWWVMRREWWASMRR